MGDLMEFFSAIVTSPRRPALFSLLALLVVKTTDMLFFSRLFFSSTLCLVSFGFLEL